MIIFLQWVVFITLPCALMFGVFEWVTSVKVRSLKREDDKLKEERFYRRELKANVTSYNEEALIDLFDHLIKHMRDFNRLYNTDETVLQIRALKLLINSWGEDIVQPIIDKLSPGEK